MLFDDLRVEVATGISIEDQNEVVVGDMPNEIILQQNFLTHLILGLTYVLVYQKHKK